jgi:hypothetical protein
LKKKQWANNKQADEEKRKKTDQEKEKANAGTVTISPPNNINLSATCHAIIGQGNDLQY